MDTDLGLDNYFDTIYDLNNSIIPNSYESIFYNNYSVLSVFPSNIVLNPTITSYSCNLSGNTNTITVTGTNFTPTNNTIYYGSETKTSLTSYNNTVSFTTTTIQSSIYISNINGSSNTILYTPPTISGYISSWLNSINTITVSGTNFTPTNNIVNFNNTDISATYISPTSLSFTTTSKTNQSFYIKNIKGKSDTFSYTPPVINSYTTSTNVNGDVIFDVSGTNFTILNNVYFNSILITPTTQTLTHIIFTIINSDIVSSSFYIQNNKGISENSTVYIPSISNDSNLIYTINKLKSITIDSGITTVPVYPDNNTQSLITPIVYQIASTTTVIDISPNVKIDASNLPLCNVLFDLSSIDVDSFKIYFKALDSTGSVINSLHPFKLNIISDKTEITLQKYTNNSYRTLTNFYFPKPSINADNEVYVEKTLDGFIVSFYSNSQIKILLANPVCYNKGTKILTIQNNQEIYQPIETLHIGDIIKVYPNTCKPIKYIGYKKCINDHQNYTTMYIMKKTNNNDLIEDLIVTGLHHVYDPNFSNEPNIILHDKTLIEACRSKLFTKVKNNDEYTYYHFVLDDGKQYGVYANGLLSESMFERTFIDKKFTLIQ
jgi:hypothetical protein